MIENEKKMIVCALQNSVFGLYDETIIRRRKKI